MDAKQFKRRIDNSAFAFRGYNVTNQGRSAELLNHSAYGAIVEQHLRESGEACSEILGRKIDLVSRVRKKRELTLRGYAEVVCMVVAMEMAQLQLLDEFFGIQYKTARLAYGYSLGEIAALVAGGVIELAEALKIPLSLARDCVSLGKNVTLGILFSRGEELPLNEVRHLCLKINSEGNGVIGVSTFISPNSLLLMGQADTLDRFKELSAESMPRSVHLRKNRSHWPPLHTPIVWEKNIPNRAAMMMHTMRGGFTAPTPPIFSMVTGSVCYDDFNTREIIHQWIDHPQRLWDAVYETLVMGIYTVVHVGPQPNIIPATFRRLADNVEVQTKGRLHMRALLAATKHPWLQAVLPARTALLRAPQVEQVILEDWLLEQELE